MSGAVFPPCYLTWGQTMVEVMKITVTSFKRSHAHTAALSAPSPAAGHRQPTPPLRLLDTHGQVWVSLLWGHCSFLLGPSVHKVLFVPSKSLFPQSCESSGCSMVGLMATSSKRAYATPRSAAPRAHATATVHCWPVPPHETVKHSSVQFLWGLLVLVHIKFVWALWVSPVGLEFDSKCNFNIYIKLYDYIIFIPVFQKSDRLCMPEQASILHLIKFHKYSRLSYREWKEMLLASFILCWVTKARRSLWKQSPSWWLDYRA